MRTWRAVYGVGLGLSVACNVWLLRNGDAEPPPAAAPANAATPDTANTAPLAVRSTVAAPQREMTAARRALEERVAHAEADLLALLPMNERFERGGPAPELEARIRPAIERAFAKVAADSDDFVLECHSNICRVETKANDEWRRAFGADETTFGWFASMSVGKTPDGMVVHVEVEDEAAAKGMNWSGRIRTAFGVAGRECKRQHPTPAGEVMLAMQLDGGRVTIDVTGPLAQQELGVCSRRALEDLMAKDPFPAGATKIMDRPFGVRTP